MKFFFFSPKEKSSFRWYTGNRNNVFKYIARNGGYIEHDGMKFKKRDWVKFLAKFSRAYQAKFCYNYANNTFVEIKRLEIVTTKTKFGNFVSGVWIHTADGWTLNQYYNSLEDYAIINERTDILIRLSEIRSIYHKDLDFESREKYIAKDAYYPEFNDLVGCFARFNLVSQ